MKHLISLLVLGVGAAVFTPTVKAQSSTAYVQHGTDLFAGPGFDYPRVEYVPGGRTVRLYGCLSDYAWCDVSAGYTRGWVDADDISVLRSGQYYGLYQSRSWYPYPILTFTFGNYWDNHYRGRPWYNDRNRYQNWDWRQRSHRWNDRDRGDRDGRGRDNDWDRDRDWNRDRPNNIRPPVINERPRWQQNDNRDIRTREGSNISSPRFEGPRVEQRMTQPSVRSVEQPRNRWEQRATQPGVRTQSEIPQPRIEQRVQPQSRPEMTSNPRLQPQERNRSIDRKGTRVREQEE